MSLEQAEQDKINQLTVQLKHDDYHVRYRAVDSLGKIGNTQAIDLLLEALGDFDIRDEESRVNSHASAALIDIGEPAVSPLIKALARNKRRRKDGWRRYWVAETLGWMRSEVAVEPLIKVLQDDDQEACEGVAEALERIGDERAIEPLRNKLQEFNETDGYIYIAISKALRTLTSKRSKKER